jgi:transcription elongation factor GreA
VIIDEAEQGKPKEVMVGTEVTIQGEDDEPETYRIVGAAEADPRNGKISNESPMGAALLGRRVGDRVRVETPGGEWRVTIKKISR